MNTKLASLIFFSMAGLLLLVLPGCYTRLATEREERPWHDEGYDSQQVQRDSGYAGESDSNYAENNNPDVVNDDYGYGWHPSCGVGFDYYYPSYYWPSYAFAAAWYDPWFYDSYWAYNPWWCGTGFVHYPYYGYYGHGPFYGGGYYGGGYGYRHYDGYAAGTNRAPRDFGATRGGNTRGVTSDRGNSGTYTGRSTSGLPTGVSGGRTSATQVRRSATVNNNSHQPANAPRGSRMTARAGNAATGSVSRSGGTRRYAPSSRGSSAPRYSSPASRGGYAPSGGGGSRGGGGGSRGGGGGSRGGGGGSRGGGGRR